ncbi:MAG TPA: DUF3343 domain-containing protein [Clostridiales bacterium]|nr:DUF3343 domain-containing protein [Clostridiales bacterium]
MGNATILISSVTAAMRAQRLLEQRGIRSYIRKIANHPKLGGCGYGLEIAGDLTSALYLLQAANIRILGIL